MIATWFIVVGDGVDFVYKLISRDVYTYISKRHLV